ncbi:MAG TPA: 2-oxo-4-hydroxy-4-carboxy-5-ureidoimidazoline decarboxylase [Longimicrobiales bacterium]|nr:2-oxo-4-hydroxy-4-carboxy-5-ureidoimidazoline decarboxylase [Longimicrobiales bacterium]
MTGPPAALRALNEASAEDALAELLDCCGSRAWARALVERRPFADLEALIAASDEVWWALGPEDWLEAFASHPRIGEREAGAGQAAAWSRAEQAGAADAPEETMAALSEGNRRYEERFGHVFLIRAAGRSASDMLSALTERMSNEPTTELRVAAAQQAEITRLRLARLVDAAGGSA